MYSWLLNFCWEKSCIMQACYSFRSSVMLSCRSMNMQWKGEPKSMQKWGVMACQVRLTCKFGLTGTFLQIQPDYLCWISVYDLLQTLKCVAKDRNYGCHWLDRGCIPHHTAIKWGSGCNSCYDTCSTAGLLNCVICDTGPCQAPPLNLFSLWHLCILSSWSNDASLKKRVLGCAGWVATGGDWLYQCTCYINTTRSLGLCQLTYLWLMLWWAWWGLVPLWSLILCFMKSLLLFMTDQEHASSGDVVEARAIQAVFKEHASCSRLAFSSTKVWSQS
jgi:hypothetical protein